VSEVLVCSKKFSVRARESWIAQQIERGPNRLGVQVVGDDRHNTAGLDLEANAVFLETLIQFVHGSRSGHAWL
jgi:hypothetical protein